MTIALEVSGVRKRFSNRTALHDVSLTARQGELLALLGANGAGKSTLIHCCVGLLRPESGHVKVFGVDAQQPPTRRPHVGLMLQQGGLPPTATPIPFLRYLSGLYENPRPWQELADLLGLHEFARTTVRRMSTGQRQRLALAAALIGRPQLVFLDEPTAGMDLDGAQAVHGLIGQLRSEGVAVVLTTHNLREAETLADRVVVLHHGRVVVESTAQALLSDFGTPTSVFTCSSAPPELTAAVAPATCQVHGARLHVRGQLTNQHMAAIIQAVDAHGIQILSCQVNHRSLDDVLGELTGSPTAQSDAAISVPAEDHS